MKYANIAEATFISRENRFVATVDMNGSPLKVHVKNTGRCRELLVHGAKVYLEKSSNAARKYVYDLVAVRKGDLLINMDSQAPNQVMLEYLRSGSLLADITEIKPEFTYGSSRFDFYFQSGGKHHLLEVKGVTLEEEGICRFPDAPTERGRKHLMELSEAVTCGYECWVCFVVQMKGMQEMRPNKRTDPDFAEALQIASDAGVHIIALGCDVTQDSVRISYQIPVKLQ